MKKSYLGLCLLVVALSGCGKKKAKKNRGKDTEVLSEVNIPVADDGINSFFNSDVEGFALKDDAAEIAKADGLGYEIDVESADPYAWLDGNKEFKNVYFAFDNYTIRDDQEQAVTVNLEKIKQKFDAAADDAKPTIYVDGNACSSAGTGAYNLALSEKRAKALKDRLVDAGIPAEYIKIVARGSEVPARDRQGNAIAGDRAQQWPNRRDEIRVL